MHLLVSALLFEDSDVGILRFDDVKDNEVATGIRIREALDAIPDLQCAEMLFSGTEMDTEHMYAEISGCRRGIHIFGGYPGGHKLNSPEHFVFDTSGVLYNSTLIITYAGKNLHFDMDKVHHLCRAPSLRGGLPYLSPYWIPDHQPGRNYGQWQQKSGPKGHLQGCGRRALLRQGRRPKHDPQGRAVMM